MAKDGHTLRDGGIPLSYISRATGSLSARDPRSSQKARDDSRKGQDNCVNATHVVESKTSIDSRNCKWNYYHAPAEQLIEKTPKGYRRIRGSNQTATSPVQEKKNSRSKNESRSSPFHLSHLENVLPLGFPYEAKHLDASSNLRPTLPSSIELHVSNLDQSIGAKDLKTILTSVFNQHVSVLGVNVHLQNDGHLAAVVRVPSLQDAQYCISQLHRRKLGGKRIMISFDQSNGPGGPGKCPPTISQIRSRVNALLADIPQERLPLFKFRELYEQRYTCSVSLSDLHRLRDILEITDDAHGRCVIFLRSPKKLSHDITPRTAKEVHGAQLADDEMARCPMHDNAPTTDGWAESQTICELPMIFSTLHDLTVHVHSLLQSHGGAIPLASIARCYEAEVGKLNVSEDKGVPFEHLISCIKGIEIATHAGHKRLQWAGKTDDPISALNPSLVPQISLLCRELVDLLKMAPQCRIPFSKFIPAYHHHFGRQCRVADYGYTRLIDLLESLPHVVQVLGEGTRRYVTLSHRAQMKRFTSDLIRILKCQTSKQIPISQFSVAYEKSFLRPFDPRDYGLCDLADLLVQVAEASVVVMGVINGESVIGMPKREQTFEEMERTRQFAAEVIELLKHAPQCKLEFAKFIPAYHHHFGKQCRVADYGCSKLIELFEAIPETVQVSEMNSEFEKFVQLTVKQRLRILAEQIEIIIKEHYNGDSLFLSDLPDLFCTQFGFALRPEQYEVVDLETLVKKLKGHLHVVNSKAGIKVCLINQEVLSRTRERVLKLLYPIPDGCMALTDLQQQYKLKFNEEFPGSFVTDHMEDLISMDVAQNVTVVRLAPSVAFCRLVHALLNENNGRLALGSLESRFLERFGSPVRPSTYGFSSLHALLLAVQHLISVRGKGSKRLISMHKSVSDLAPPHFARLASSSGLKPPASWLTPKSEKDSLERVESSQRKAVPSPVSTVANSLNSFTWSPLTARLPHKYPPVLSPFSWALAPHMAGLASSWSHGLNQTIPPNYWVAAWHPPFPYTLPVASFAFPKMGCAAAAATDEAKLINRVTSYPAGIAPPASVLPLPPREMRAAEMPKSTKSVKSRIAAQFNNCTSESF